MRLWHEGILNKLPRQQLLGQHRECAALLGLGWNKKHSVVQYALNGSLERLKAYHLRVIDEMTQRGYVVSPQWTNAQYRGQSLGIDTSIDIDKVNEYYILKCYIYKEHNDEYLQECLLNLKQKGIVI